MRRSLTNINNHRYLTSLCNAVYIPYATHDIDLSLFLISVSLEIGLFSAFVLFYMCLKVDPKVKTEFIRILKTSDFGSSNNLVSRLPGPIFFCCWSSEN